MATYQIYAANRLIGGTDGCLDYIDGAGLNDNDSAIVIHAIDNNAYFYRLDASSGATQNTPEIVAPVQNAGTKRWLLVDVVCTNVTPQNQILTDPDTTITTNTAINEFSTDGTMADDSDNAVPTEKAVKTYVNTVFPSATRMTFTEIPGYLRRPSFYQTETTLQIVGGTYHTNGATERIVTISDITFTGGSGGSNTSSHDLDDATDWHYIYIDDSSLSAGQTALLAENLINLQTEPTWSDANHGWYNGNDRCIFAFYDIDGAGDLRETRCHGQRRVMEGDNIALLNGVDVDAASTTVTAVVPSFCRYIGGTIRGNHVDQNSEIFVYATGKTDILYQVSQQRASADRIGQNVFIPLDSSYQFDVAMGDNSNNTMHLFQTVWYLPAGM